jgi:threonine aldolase
MSIPTMSDLPPPPEVSFASDNTAGVDPVVMDALAKANTPAALAYGADDWSRRLTDRFGELLDRDVVVLPCWGGTGANVVGLASLLRPWQAVVCTEHAHVATDECGAPTRFTGSTLLTLPSEDGKLDPAALATFAGRRGDVHHVQPAVVSVSQSTELGTVYDVDELAAVAGATHAADLLLHLDGARVANAVAATGSDLRSMAGETGVDVMTFGVTKNGAMYGEAVVYLRPELATGAAFHQKQSAQLPSKMRFVSAQLLALLENDRWIDNATHANRMATLLAAALAGIDGVEMLGAPEANAVFARLPAAAIPPLQQWSFFWRWPGDSLVRWMTSFATTESDVERFVEGVRTVIGALR